MNWIFQKKAEKEYFRPGERALEADNVERVGKN
jgi:hypothetical protein